MQLQQTDVEVSGWLRLIADDERRPLPAEMTNELESLRKRLQELWILPSGARGLTVEVSIKLKRDRTLDGPPVVLIKGEGPLFESSRDSALNAIRRGQPFTMLRPEHYDLWKEVVMTFTDARFPPR